MTAQVRCDRSPSTQGKAITKLGFERALKQLRLSAQPQKESDGN